MTTAKTRPAPDAADDRTLVLRRRFSAPPARVFRAWTEPSELVKWWGPGGFTVPLCEMDVREGGAYRTCMRSPAGEDHYLRGVYLEITPPTRLVFTWAWEQGDTVGDETLVTVELNEVRGGTELVLTHSGFATTEARDRHNMGWSSSLDDCLANQF